ncbi:HAMP domain-containing histidine kinase [Xanthomonas melonis]|uniref:sensor histidine kinase n=1 Tax=Xanthomonas melonis TaxID=56456 RepID=UPI001E655146|nr:HAMP domain-containing sensor histidine kinase [Xanthomonas melonis]MCD0279186.1 HAMP domain-containing histidine kinase [Xanthomonas melonis]
MSRNGRPRSLQWMISASLLMSCAVLAFGLSVQGLLSQEVIEDPIWQQLLTVSTENVARLPQQEQQQALPRSGPVKGWLLREGAPLPADMPAFFDGLAPGYYGDAELDTQGDPSTLAKLMSIVRPHWGPFADDTGSVRHDRSYSALVTALPQGRLIMSIELTALEDKQNGSVQLSVLFFICNLAMIGLVIWWLFLGFARPVQDLARRMRRLDPLQPAQRLPTDYRKSELNTIAREANAHLERVERAIERERSLLDQASHEFRTPLAVISGAADVLHKQQLPERALGPLHRIDEAVDNLTRIMEALLYLSREPTPAERRQVTILHGVLPELVHDHLYLVSAKPVEYRITALEPLTLQAPESMVRIAVGNLLRNAADHTYAGEIEVSVCDHRLRIRDSGEGFDTALAAQRYTESLKQSVKQGGGAGLGLFLTRRICERFGWRLHLESSAAQGTLAMIDFRP